MKQNLMKLLAVLFAALMLTGCGDRVSEKLTSLPIEGTVIKATEWSEPLMVDEENGSYVVCQIENQGESALIVWVDDEERMTIEKGRTEKLVLEVVGRADYQLSATGYPNGHRVSMYYKLTQQNELN